MEQPIDEERIAEMLVQFRDSLTAMSLMLKDYQANLDVIRQGQMTQDSDSHVDAIRTGARTAHNEHSR